MAKNITAALCGLIFGLGLTISAMIDPAKVLGFLNVFGDWDPSLIFVMGAGLAVTYFGYGLTFRRKTALFGTAFPPLPGAIDGRLIIGAVLFGAGWGLAGYCPGPALAALTLGGPKTFVFVGAMLIGMAAHSFWQRRLQISLGGT